jgi:hypothetical protein
LETMASADFCQQVEVRACCWLSSTGEGCEVQPVGAENGVTAADLVFAVVLWVMKLGIWLRSDGRIRHFQYSCHYDWLI